MAKSKDHVIIISKDADFYDLVNRLGSPPKLIVIKKGNCDNREMWNFIRPNILKAVRLLATSDVDIVELD